MHHAHSILEYFKQQFRMRKQRKFIFLGCFFLATSGFAGTSNEIDRCMAAINSIKSYDVTFTIQHLSYPNYNNLTKPDASVVAITDTNRDVLAVGLGRRIERGVGNNKTHTIGVIDWNTAITNGRPLAKALTFVLPGLTYYDYVNPPSGNFFLSDLLSDKHFNIIPLEPNATNSEMAGFQVSSSASTGFIRVWPDPKHGYMPSKVEWYHEVKDGQISLLYRMEVEKFIQIDDGDWVPAKAILTSIMPTGTAKGREVTGFLMTVDTTHSSWNSINSSDLFLAKSLPTVNSKQDGWKFYYSPPLLSSIKAAEAIRSPENFGLVRGVVLGGMGAITLLLVIILIMHRRRANEQYSK
jgi:hypothetical protein